MPPVCTECPAAFTLRHLPDKIYYNGMNNQVISGKIPRLSNKHLQRPFYKIQNIYNKMNTTTADTLFREAHSFMTQIPPDFAAAVPLLQKAANEGHTEAEFHLAGCLLQGQGIPANREAGIRLMQQAARDGHPYASYNLLQIQEAQGMPLNTLLPSYRELAEAGIIEAQLKLMRAYHDAGQHEEAVDWAVLAARQQNPQALYFLGQHCQYTSPPDYPQSHQLYQLAAKQGFTPANWQLGLQYKLGQGVAPDLEQAAQHLYIAASDNIAPAQVALAEILLPTHPDKAIRWLETAARQNSSDAYAKLAEIHLLGKDVPKDTDKARRYAKAAARRNHPEALRLLGDIYRYGLGILPEPSKARHYYQLAADLGNLAAHQKLLADIALNNKQNYPQAKEHALQRQQAEQFYQLAFAAHYGLNRAPDHTEALTLYQQAADLGHSKAQTNLGMMYYNGHGTETDYTEAAKWFAQAAQQKDTMAQYNLACLYFHGTGVRRNTALACRWLETAINDGHEQSEILKQLLAHWKQQLP